MSGYLPCRVRFLSNIKKESTPMNQNLVKLAVISALLVQGATMASFAAGNAFQASESTTLASAKPAAHAAKCGAGSCGGKTTEADHKCGSKEGEHKCATKEGEHKCGSKEGEHKCATKAGEHKCGKTSCAAKVTPPVKN